MFGPKDKYSGGFLGRNGRPVKTISENRSAFVRHLLLEQVNGWREEIRRSGLESIAGFSCGVLELVIWKRTNPSEPTRIGELKVERKTHGFEINFEPT